MSHSRVLHQGPDRAAARPHWRHFAVAQSGVAAVEFAFVLPLMVLLYLGGFEVAEGLVINRKVTHATSVLADLVAQDNAINATEMDNILDAVAAVLHPYPTEQLRIIVSGVTVSSQGSATVAWSDARNQAALPMGTGVSLPAGLTQPNTFIVVAEVAYNYAPLLGQYLLGAVQLSSTAHFRPRISSQIVRN
jgi:Flp pilus assembly protein TadG